MMSEQCSIPKKYTMIEEFSILDTGNLATAPANILDFTHNLFLQTKQNNLRNIKAFEKALNTETYNNPGNTPLFSSCRKTPLFLQSTC